MNARKTETAVVNKSRRTVRKADALPAQAGSDRRLTPAEMDKWIKKARRIPRVRRELVERVKSEIDSGVYETPRKIKITVDGLLDEMD